MLSHVEPCWVTLIHVEPWWTMLSHVEPHWVIFRYIEPLWVTLIHVEPCWTMFSYTVPRWVTLSYLESRWVTLSHVKSRWAMLSYFESCWVTLSHVKPCWVTLSHFKSSHVTSSPIIHVQCPEIMWLFTFSALKSYCAKLSHVRSHRSCGVTWVTWKKTIHVKSRSPEVRALCDECICTQRSDNWAIRLSAYLFAHSGLFFACLALLGKLCLIFAPSL